MLDARIISVNPGTKSAGELNTPRRTQFEGVIYRLEQVAESSVASHHSHGAHFGIADADRPRVTTLILRILVAAVCVVSAIYLSSAYVSIALIAAAVFTALGLFTRPSAVAGCCLSLCVVAFNNLSYLFAPSMLASAICIMLSLILLLSGPGAFSLDAMIWRRSR